MDIQVNTQARRAKKKRASLLPIALILVFAAVCAAAVCLTLPLIGRQKDFSSSSDYAFVKDYISGEGKDLLISLCSSYISENITEFENEEEMKALYSKKLSEESIMISRSDDYTDKAPVYTVFVGGKAFFKTTLSHDGKTLSGFNKWKIDSVTLADSCEIGEYTYIEAPHGSSVTLNGASLSEEYLSTYKTEYYALTEFEEHLSNNIYCDKYEIGFFFGEPEIDAVFEGYRLNILDRKGGTVRFSYPPSLTSIQSITVPYGSSVTVNGKPLSGAYVSETGLPYSFITRFEKNVSGIITSLTYQISGLFEAPDIKVTYNGVTLEKDAGSSAYRLPDDTVRSYKILAPEGTTVKLNGVSLGKSEVSAEKTELPILDELKNYAKKRPYLVEYTVNGLLSVPKITASDKNGISLVPDTYYSKGNTIYYLPAASEAPPEQDIVTLKAFSRYFVKYFYSGSSGVANNFANITGMTPGKSLAYTKLKAEYKTIQKSDIYKSIKYGTPEYYDYIAYSDTTFSCMVKLPFTAKLNGEQVSEELKIQILYIYSGNIRRVVNYLVFE